MQRALFGVDGVDIDQRVTASLYGGAVHPVMPSSLDLGQFVRVDSTYQERVAMFSDITIRVEELDVSLVNVNRTARNTEASFFHLEPQSAPVHSATYSIPKPQAAIASERTVGWLPGPNTRDNMALCVGRPRGAATCAANQIM